MEIEATDTETPTLLKASFVANDDGVENIVLFL